MIEFFRRVDFLSEAPDKLLESIACRVEEWEVPAGKEIFADGEPGDAMYFIAEGTVRIEKLGQLLLKRGPGDYIGEFALVDDAPRSASAVAETAAVLLRWRKDSFQHALESDGRIAYQVCRSFCAQIRKTTESVSLIQQDLERAVLLQRAILPESTFSNGMIELAARCFQTEKVGGDYFDYLPFGENQIAILLADAQGHGFSAALLVAMLKTRLHSRAARDRSPSGVVAALNQTLKNQINQVQMATGIYLLIDRDYHELRYCSAGHIRQYHYRASRDELDTLDNNNLLLGFQDQASSEVKTAVHSWAPGDLLILFTDGVTEATNAEGEELGPERLRDLIWKYRRGRPEEILSALRQEVRAFHGPGPFSDDVTLLVARLS